MNIITKMKQSHYFSASEQSIIDYLLKNPEEIRPLTTKQLADRCYSSSSTVVRLCRKLDCKGYNDFKILFLSEIEKTNKAITTIDANYPFQKNASLPEVCNSLKNLYADAIFETTSLIDYESYKKAASILYKAKYIDIYGAATNQSLAYDFKMNMLRINHKVNIPMSHQELVVNAAYSTPEHASIVISYTGETPETLEYCKLLKATGSPMICITSLDNNSISDYCDISLKIVSKEKMFSKIGMFSSKISIMLILDILYSNIFLIDYDENIKLTQEKRKITTPFRASAPFLEES